MQDRGVVSRLSVSRLVGELLRDPERKSLVRILLEAGYLTLHFRKLPTHYFSRYLFKKDCKNITDYLPGTFLYSIKSKFNDQAVRIMLDNKLYFDFYYRQLNFNLPKIGMFNHRKVFVIGNDHIEVSDVDHFKDLIEQTIKSNSSDNTVFIKKTYGSYQGANIYKVHLNEVRSSAEKMSHLYVEVVKSGFLFQETIQQHDELARLNPSCLNTLRLDTFINADGRIEIISGYLKTNLREHFIDNEPSGACEIPIDLDTGKLKRYGHLAIKYNGLVRPVQHPNTKVVFEDFTIPCFNEAKELAIHAASVIPGLRLVGWDVAIGKNGPVLIEGNSDYDIAANDLNYGGYRANPGFQKVLQEIKYL